MKRVLILTLCILYSYFIYSQQVRLTGTVTDSQGETIIGCTIHVLGTTNGTITDVDGKYSITANVGDNLNFSYLGYISTVVKIIAGKTVYDVVLQEDVQQLSETIVVAYGIAPAQKQILSLSQSPYDSLNEEEYTKFGENKFKQAASEPISTFSADVDKASYSNVRRFLEKGLFPPRDAIRTEELINYFPYDYRRPTQDNPIVMQAEIGKSPWDKQNYLLQIGLKTREIPTDKLPPSNFVFLIDVSGSMFGPTRLDLVKASMSLLTDNLKKRDKVAIVVYAGSAGVVLPSTSGDNKIEIKDALERLEAGGSTAGGEGILLAYKIAKENFIDGGNNRIILCTDGDFNVGISSNYGLEELIEKERKSGVFLSILGYGMGNYKDSKMQTLAQKGNGNHAYIDNMSEAKRVLISEFAGTLYTTAKDVKLQVEFNPNRVEAYRLIGYETRLLKNEDFEDDTKDAGDMGSGHTVTAMYELILKKVPEFGNGVNLVTVDMRYKDPQEDISKLLSIKVADNEIKSTNTVDFNFASSVAMFSQLLRDSEYKGNATYKDVEKLAASALGKDKQGYRKEFLELVKKVDKMTSSGKPIRYGNVEMKDDFDTFYETDSDGVERKGIKDKGGNIIIPAKYDDIDYQEGSVFIVEREGKYGLYQYYSGELTPLKYDNIESYNSDLYIVELNESKGVIDLYGKEIIEPQYEDIENEYGYIKVEKQDKYGLYNLEGKLIVPAKFDNIHFATSQSIIVEKDGKYGVYNMKGKNVIPVRYTNIEQNRDILVIEKANEKYGFANEKGKLVVSPNYDETPDHIVQGIYMLSKNKKIGLVNTNGKIIVPIKYEDIDDLTPDIFTVTKEDDKIGAFNSKGKKIANEIYDTVDLLYDTELIMDEGGLYGYIVVERNDKYGVISASGKLILPVVYDDIDSNTEDGELYIIARKDGQEFAFNRKGILIAKE